MILRKFVCCYGVNAGTELQIQKQTL